MSAVKRTPIPIPGRTSVATPTPKPRTEIIIDDDSSDSSSASDASSSSESEAEKKKSSKKANVKQGKKAEPAKSPSSSEESSEESSDEEESESEKASASKDKASSDTASGSGSGSEESESESESEDESAEESAVQSAPKTTPSSRLQTTQFRSAYAFEPPSGFKQVKSDLNPSSNLAKLLQSTDVLKKQIWHITAPAAIDIKQIKEFTRGKAMGKKPVIQHNGVGYAFVPEEKSTRVPAKLLVPSENGYTAVPTEIAETLHLQQVVALPKLTDKQTSAGCSTAAVQKFVERPEKPARPQPKGLRMRYKTFGDDADVAGTIGLSDSEDGDAFAQAKPKRKHDDANGSTEASSKKSKKDKKKHKSQDNVDDGEAMEGVEPTAATNGKEASAEKKKEKKDKKDKDKKEKKEKKKRKE